MFTEKDTCTCIGIYKHAILVYALLLQHAPRGLYSSSIYIYVVSLAHCASQVTEAKFTCMLA